MNFPFIAVLAWALFAVTITSPLALAQRVEDGWRGEWKFSALYVPDGEAYRRRAPECMTQVWESKHLNLDRGDDGSLSGDLILVRRASVLAWLGSGTRTGSYLDRCGLSGAKAPLDGAQIKTFLVKGKLSNDGRSATLLLHSGKCQSANDWCEGSTELGLRAGVREEETKFTLGEQGVVEEWSGPVSSGGSATAFDQYVSRDELEARAGRIVSEAERVLGLFAARNFKAVYDALEDPKQASYAELARYWEGFFLSRGEKIEETMVVEKLITTDRSDRPWRGTISFDVLTNRSSARLYVLMQGKDASSRRAVTLIWR